MDMSLQKLMRINRGMFFQSTTPVILEIPVTPVVTQPPVSSTPPLTPTYTFADFGENIINSHYQSDGSHSERCQTIFNYITKDFRDRCTSYQSYNTLELGNTFLYRQNYLSKCALLNADLVFTPYVNAAYSSAGEYENFVLAVASHHENNGTDGNLYDDERHDITPDANTFLTDSIAVSARRDTPSEFKGSTSYGLGMEFFEDCSREALDVDYPVKEVPVCFWECKTNESGTVLSNARTQTNSQIINVSFEVGQQVWVVRPDGSKEYTTITSFIDSDNFNISPALTPIVGYTLYSWHNDTFGGFVNNQAQSWAVPIVAGKLKVIKMTTNSDWETVRMAARATAKRNPTGIPEIDNANWDMWRGFGCIQVQDAINYINNN